MNSMDNYKHKAITSTMYSSGLRVSEVCRLRYEDVRRSQRMIHVPLSKNRQDRYTILSDRNLEILTEYWYRYNRPRGWLFPSTVRDEPLTTAAVETFIKDHARALGLPEGVTPHNDASLFRLPCPGGRYQPHVHPAAFRAPQPEFHRCVPADDIKGPHGDQESIRHV